MKARVSLLIGLLALSPFCLLGQPLPWELSTAHEPTATLSTSGGEEATLVSSPSPFEEAEADTAACAPATLFKADPNETSVEVTERYTRAQDLMIKGAWRRAQLVLERGIEKFPESRNLRMLYAELLWYLSNGGEDRALLGQSAEQAIRAMEIGLSFRIVDYSLLARLSQTLSRTGDADNFERLFARALALDPGPVTHRQYALGLSRMNSPRTEEAFKTAVALETEGDAHVDYGEWLLDRKRDADALDMLPQKPSRIYYLHFLRGLALERSNRHVQARKAYAAFRNYSASFPAPLRFRIKDSSLQRDSGIRFDDGTRRGQTSGIGGIQEKALTNQQAINGLSYMLWGEARGEQNYGAILAVGWVARARALRGTVEVTNPCPYVVRSGTTLGDYYKSVMCQSGAFYGVCPAWCSDPSTTLCSSLPTTNSAAYDVFYGKKPDPVSTHCPGGVAAAGNYCSGTIKTCVGATHTYLLASPLFQLAVSPSVACQQSDTCAPNVYGKTCGDGLQADHCFYGNRTCAGTRRYGYDGTISTAGSYMYTQAYPVSFTNAFHQGHLEGPENANFNLYLQYSSTGSDPWTDVAQTTQQAGSVEDIGFTTSQTGYYRWRVVSVSGTGYWFACTKRP